MSRDEVLASQNRRLRALGVRVEEGPAGRRVVAERDFEAGSVVLSTTPLEGVLLPRHALSRCAHCWRRREKLSRCGACQRALYCDRACQRRGFVAGHRFECKAMAELFSLDDGVAVDVLVASRVGRRLLHTERQTSCYSVVAATALDARGMLLWHDGDAPAVPESWAALGCDGRALAAGRRNNFCVADEMLEGIAAVSSPIGALLNHSCAPTCVVSYSPAAPDKPPVQHFVAIRRVRCGEELTHAYVDVGAPTRERRAILETNYGFRCECARCAASWTERDARLEGTATLNAVAAETEAATALRTNADLLERALLCDDDDEEAHILEAAAEALDGVVSPDHCADTWNPRSPFLRP
ncbi:hypothetical protein CTAYLR_008518 [Chrysophaeum taylorii]|uniref:Uncharacterized protein n=1 Tax=Chrysophaeum taylorii TaxID=2483200 RepID=A0AAD7UBD7_9STRA|nr:hypothetical protein CTAYLR_008518 [Chrysophaeum taylorii]